LGKIVISSSTDGGKEIVKDEENGFLFEIGNGEDLAEKINKVINLDSLKIREIKKQARETSKQFKWLNLIKKLEELLENEI